MPALRKPADRSGANAAGEYDHGVLVAAPFRASARSYPCISAPKPWSRRGGIEVGQVAIQADRTGRAAGGRGTFLLADISGYTGFLQGVADAHRTLIVGVDEPPAAYSLMSSLLDVILTAVEPPFRLVKFEGDAVFAVGADSDFGLRGEDVLACVRACHAAFTARLGEANSLWSCT